MCSCLPGKEKASRGVTAIRPAGWRVEFAYSSPSSVLSTCCVLAGPPLPPRLPKYVRSSASSNILSWFSPSTKNEWCYDTMLVGFEPGFVATGGGTSPYTRRSCEEREIVVDRLVVVYPLSWWLPQFGVSLS